MPEMQFNIPRFLRFARNSVAMAGLAMFIGGIAWHDVAVAVAVLGFVLAGIAVFGMILTRRN